MKNLQKIILFSSLWFCIQLSVSAQIIELKGIIKDGITHRPVQLVHVQNFSSNRAVLSDTTGLFQIRASTGDTLVLSAIGYNHTVFMVPDSLINEPGLFSLIMNPRIYEIEEASVYAFGSYNDFKQRFLALDLSKDKTEILRRNIDQQTLLAAREGYKMFQQKEMSDGGNLLNVPILSSQEKQMLRLKEIRKSEHKKNIAYAKFNPDIVKKVTGITTDEIALEFMQFCNFSDDFVIQTEAYDLMVIIAHRYEQYLQMKKGKAEEEGGQLHRDETDLKIC
jgi:hypothetical protein